MQQTESQPDDDWTASLNDALRACPDAGPGLLLFVEERQDLVIEVCDADPPTATQTWTRGISARGPFDRPWLLHRAGAAPSDAKRLLRAAIDPGAGFPFAGDEGGRVAASSPAFAVAELSDWLRGVVDRVRSSCPSVAVRARWVGFEQKVHVARPGAPPATDVRRSRRLRIEAMVGGEPSGGPAVGEVVLSPHAGAVEGALTAMLDRLAVDIDRRRRPRESADGLRTVVMAPGVGGIVAHELIGHALEADTVGRNGSWLGSAPDGGTVTSPALTVIDDPRRGRAPWRIDDEGEPPRAVPLVRDGVVVGLLHDTRSAMGAGRPPTGHGRRSSFRDPVRPRMGCTFIAPGEASPEEILEGVADGVYVRRLEAATTDPTKGRATFRVTDADRIHRGRLDAPLRPFLLYVDGKETLRDTVLVGNDLEFDRCIGSCHRDGEPLTISVGAPTICIGLVMAFS